MKRSVINRREFIKQSAQGLAGLTVALHSGKSLFAAPHIRNSKISQNIFVLGIDGMDPNLLKFFVDRGEMPTFKKFLESYYFGPLRTTLPPQSPVAWSSFITGTNPGGNGIYDFIHRDPKTFIPHLSTTRSLGIQKSLRLGKWAIPVQGGKIELLRGGQPFWAYLEKDDIPATFYKIPANFPVASGESSILSGMSTPDLLGTYGTFTLVTDMDIPHAEQFTGGRVVRVRPENDTVRFALEGPPNEMRTDGRKTKVDMTVYRDPWENVVKIVVEDREILLSQGEWSEWIPIKFELMPLLGRVHGMIRMYVQQVHPHIRLYISPINVDPVKADLPISNPESYSRNLAEDLGRFYTQGFPEDTKALSHNVFSDDEFLHQSSMVLDERLQAFHHEIDGFREGLFFFYFSTIDQNSHMMLRNMDPSHPLYEPEASPAVKEAIYHFYRDMDDVLKKTLSRMDESSTFILLSDHGFAPFTRELHLSTWLVDNGYTAVTDRDKIHDSTYFDYVDWSRTKAFAYGLNGVYINAYGREPFGSVYPTHIPKIKAEIIDKLHGLRDPKTGRRIVLKAHDASRAYSGPYAENAPDIVLGYASGYRISDESVLGKFPRGIVGDRRDKWSADHCMDPQVVPGVLLTNRTVTSEAPAIWDLAPSILKGFGLEVPREMDGKPILG